MGIACGVSEIVKKPEVPVSAPFHLANKIAAGNQVLHDGKGMRVAALTGFAAEGDCGIIRNFAPGKVALISPVIVLHAADTECGLVIISQRVLHIQLQFPKGAGERGQAGNGKLFLGKILNGNMPGVESILSGKGFTVPNLSVGVYGCHTVHEKLVLKE